MSLNRIKNEIERDDRIYGLDVLRALAICLVVYEHGNFLLELVSPSLASARIIDGVDLFFVLSGFLIGGILLRGMQRQEISFDFVKRFLVRRWFRTLPNYFLFLFINIFLIYFGLANGYLNKYLVTFFFFLQNFIKPYDFLYWESWSLSVEEWFYLLFPILLLLGVFLLRKNAKMLFLLCTLLFILFSTGVRFMKAERSFYYYETWDLWIRKLVICRFDSIGFGLLAAWVRFYFYNAWVKYRWILFALGVTLFIFLLQNDFESNKYFTETSYFTLSALAAALLLPLAEQTKKYYTMAGKLVTLISLVSYAMYLTNMGVTAAIIRNNLDYASQPLLVYLFYWGFTLLFSIFIYTVYEKPITDLRERFS
jgi:peptidoglycan/LPS O-acetylase OafA/YrhL